MDPYEAFACRCGARDVVLRESYKHKTRASRNHFQMYKNFVERGTSPSTGWFSWSINESNSFSRIFIESNLFSTIFNTSTLFSGSFNTSKLFSGKLKKCRIRTFLNYLRSMLMIDAAHLEGLYKETNLVVVAMDGNNKIVPIAFGICKGETGPCWSWWMLVLKECIDDNLNLLFISDRHLAIAMAVENKFSLAFHAICCRHLMQNLSLKNKKRKGLFWKICKAYTQEDYATSMNILQIVQPDAYEKLCRAGPQRWSITHCLLVRYNYMTSNCVESFNDCSVIYRKEPVLKLAETYRAMVQECKIIANRIKESLKTLISPNQSAFVPGHSIADSILLTQELMHNYHLDRRVPRCAFKVDIQKAYDTVDWNFIQLLMDLSMDTLRVREMELINSCFADDLFLFAHGDSDSASVIMEALDEFKFTSGLVPSLPKSTAYFCNVLNHIKIAILQILSFEEGSLPFKYLGVPLVSSRVVYRDCKELIEKVESQINVWKNKSLSNAGRLQLVQSFISSMHVYWSSMFILPTRVLLNIEQLMRGFLGKGRSKVAWEVICLPKAERGLGIKRLGVFNNGLMSSHIWKLLTRKESLWVQWIYTYKFKDRNFWDIPCHSNMTWGWRKILQLRPLIWEFCCFKIGDGSCTSIWFDNWCSLSLLASIISSRDIYRACLTSSSKVSDLLLEGTLQEWRNRSGNIVPFLVNEVWNSIRPMAAKVDWFRVIWFTNCIPRHAINFWLIIKKRLRTQDMLCSWDISGCLATNCPLCDMQPDSHEHLFFYCTLSKSIWDRVKITTGLSNSSLSIDSIVSDILPFANHRTTRSVIAKLVVAATAFKLMTCRFKKSRDGLAILRQWKLSEMVLSQYKLEIYIDHIGVDFVISKYIFPNASLAEMMNHVITDYSSENKGIIRQQTQNDYTFDKMVEWAEQEHFEYEKTKVSCPKIDLSSVLIQNNSSKEESFGENVRLTVLMKLQEALDEEAVLEEEILSLMHRFIDRFTDRRVEINNMMVLHDHPLNDYGKYALRCMTGADMKKCVKLKGVRDELLRSMEEKRQLMMNYRNM
nr:hypothetical protein [Tanacetum cinerariifolium]